MSLAFIDTHVLVYALDARDERKQSVARELINQLVIADEGALNVQVLAELSDAAQRKLGLALDSSVLRDFLALLAPLVRSPTTLATFRSASALAVRHRLRLWDALVLQAAIEAGCDRLYSEDFSSGGDLAGVTLINPFALAVHQERLPPPVARRPSARRK